MIFVINNNCNRSCSYCFEGDFTTKKTEYMSLENVHRILDFQKNITNHTIMGGEPTLHPEIIRIAQIIQKKSMNNSPLVLTNGLCDTSIIQELRNQANAHFTINLNHRDPYSPQEFSSFIRNLEYLAKQKSEIALSITIADPADSFSLLYDILKNPTFSNIRHIRIGISTPGSKFSNVFPKELSSEFGNAYLKLVERCHQINPALDFYNECAVNFCLVDSAVYNKLSSRVSLLYSRCDNGNFDILPNLSTHWCFAAESIPELTIPNIFNYPTWWHVEKALIDKKRQLQLDLLPQCSHAKCSIIGCSGPCIIHNYYRKNIRVKQ